MPRHLNICISNFVVDLPACLGILVMTPYVKAPVSLGTLMLLTCMLKHFGVDWPACLGTLVLLTCMSRHLGGPGEGRANIGEVGGLARADIRMEHFKKNQVQNF